MKANVGGVDRVLRIVAGVGLLAWMLMGPDPARWWGAIGVVPLLTGIFSFCPLYGLIGLNTCPMKKA